MIWREAAGKIRLPREEIAARAYNIQSTTSREAPMPRYALQMVLIGTLLLPLARTADAQVLRACALERQEFCSAVPAGGGQIVRCLRASAGQASGMCLQALESRPLRTRLAAWQGGAVVSAPAASPSYYSPGSGMAAPPPGPGPASAAQPPRPARRIAQACAAERQQFCTGVQPGGGRVIECLRANAGQASARCGRALQARMMPRGGYGPAGGAKPAAMPGAAPGAMPAGAAPAGPYDATSNPGLQQ
jgi:hypothetical protein